MLLRAVRLIAVIGAVLLTVPLAGCAATPGSWFRPAKPTITMSVSEPCPKTLGKARDVADRSSGSSTLLPTSGTLSTVLVCSYQNRELTSQSRIEPTSARKLASAINKIDLSAPKGTFNCPAAFDSATIMAFRFGSSDDVDLWYSDSGCQTLDNGRLGAFEGANPSFYTTFMNTYAQLVPSSSATGN